MRFCYRTDNRTALLISCRQVYNNLYLPVVYFAFYPRYIKFYRFLLYFLHDNAERKNRRFTTWKRFVSIAVAKTIEVGQKAIDYWERNVNDPKASYMTSLVKYFEITYDEFFRDLNQYEVYGLHIKPFIFYAFQPFFLFKNKTYRLLFDIYD